CRATMRATSPGAKRNAATDFARNASPKAAPAAIVKIGCSFPHSTRRIARRPSATSGTSVMARRLQAMNCGTPKRSAAASTQAPELCGEEDKEATSGDTGERGEKPEGKSRGPEDRRAPRHEPEHERRLLEPRPGPITEGRARVVKQISRDRAVDRLVPVGEAL